ncbi:hypothetical protein LOK49_LG12G01766 [Camellia lanceoleosa]|uniref:Uncharacterized protein n=1 Tax=Camellia lanceoleosa TaxID=1840588 RepID=A0ACC0FNA4_9ERIC|nr:hypothetical protein LOK49_LG12G01766 [Camellia lanceoleosa]
MGPKKRSGNDLGTVVRSTRKVVVKETVQISVSETKRKAEIVTPTKQTVVEDKTQEEEQDQTVQEQDEDHDEMYITEGQAGCSSCFVSADVLICGDCFVLLCSWLCICFVAVLA